MTRATPGQLLGKHHSLKEWSRVRAVYVGHEALTFNDYIDVETGRTLFAEPGHSYDIIPASGHLVPDFPAPWFVAAEWEPGPETAAEPEPVQEPQPELEPQAEPDHEPAGEQDNEEGQSF